MLLKLVPRCSQGCTSRKSGSKSGTIQCPEPEKSPDFRSGIFGPESSDHPQLRIMHLTSVHGQLGESEESKLYLISNFPNFTKKFLIVSEKLIEHHFLSDGYLKRIYWIKLLGNLVYYYLRDLQVCLKIGRQIIDKHFKRYSFVEMEKYLLPVA